MYLTVTNLGCDFGASERGPLSVLINIPLME